MNAWRSRWFPKVAEYGRDLPVGGRPEDYDRGGVSGWRTTLGPAGKPILINGTAESAFHRERDTASGGSFPVLLSG